MDSILIYLVQVSICQTAFYLLYKFTLKNQSFFQANRLFLMFSTAISFVIPLLSFPVWSANESINFNGLASSFFSKVSEANSSSGAGIEEGRATSWISILAGVLFAIFLIGFSFHLTKTLFGLRKISAFIRKYKTGQDNGIIWTQHGPSFFSFWKYIFINEQKFNLSDEEFDQVIRHEKIHIQQLHTIDILFAELAVALCWFNPFIYRIRNELIQIHEFIADSNVVMGDFGIDEYSRLILQLSSSKNTLPLTHQFSKINIKNRIIMLNQSNTTKMKAFKFLLAVPVFAILIVAFSFTEKAPESSNSFQASQQGDRVIGQIHWEGNTKYADEKLNKVLGIKPGDVYNKETLENLLKYNPDITTVADLYMDHGYLYFNITLRDTIIDERVNLTFEIYEGVTATVDKIIIKGNETVPTQKVLEMMEFKKGDLFNRTKLVASQRNIAKSGYFDEGNVSISPIPHDDFKQVDLEFTVHEIKRN